jgi:hypothetical protein
MKHYSSFLVRCWLIDDTSDERSVIDVEHIQSGGRTKVTSMGEAEQWMLEACRPRKLDPLEASSHQDRKTTK